MATILDLIDIELLLRKLSFLELNSIVSNLNFLLWKMQLEVPLLGQQNTLSLFKYRYGIDVFFKYFVVAMLV